MFLGLNDVCYFLPLFVDDKPTAINFLIDFSGYNGRHVVHIARGKVENDW